jgi:hypothetical protein
MISRFVYASAAFLVASISCAYAGELTYNFRSPSFGGNPNNATYLQYEASSNNQHKDDGARTATQDSIADLVRRSVSFQLANNINEAIFGTSFLASGTSLLGDGSSVSWSRSGSLVTVTFIGVDGTQTSFVVPDPT